MDRRRFFSAARPSSPEFEVLPGVFAHGGDVDWGYRAPRPDAGDARRADGGPPAPLDTDTGLAPYVPSPGVPWSPRRARHLLRRTGFAALPSAVDEVLATTPGAAVDALVAGVTALPDDPSPPWIDDAPPHWSEPEEVKRAYWDENWPRFHGRRIAFLLEALGEPALAPLDDAVRGLHQRLRVMWHNHFVTHRESYSLAPWAVRYWQMLGRNALGNARTFVHQAGLDPAMLVYLNGVYNRAEAPNENYARELLELFTMGITGPTGQPNYTQADVTEISRALTGWGVDYYGETPTPLEPVFVPEWHDDGDKTIFGRTGPWGYDDVVDLVFEERTAEVAWWTATVLYREFVYDVPHPGVVAALADRLVAEDWELAPVVRALLRSEHFFSDAALGARVRSPIEHHVGVHREIGFAPDDEFVGAVHYTMQLCGQSLFEPPTVAGWPGGRTWLDTSRLTSRWLYDSWLIWQQETYRDLAAAMPDPWDAARLAADLADTLLGTPLSPAEADALTPILLNGIPPYEWNPTAPGAENRIRQLVAHLLRLPELQLA